MIIFNSLIIMQGDHLLKQWQNAKKTCKRIIQIYKNFNLNIGNQKGVIVSPGQKQTCRQFISVYDVVYRLCMTKQKEQNRVLMVYKDYKQLLKTAILEIVPLVQKQNDIFRLANLKKVWDCYMDIQRRLNNMFSYLNRPFHIKQGKIDDLDKTSNNIILSTLFLQNSVHQYEILYFKQIDKIRKHKDFSNYKILANLVDIFYQIHLKIIKNSSNKKTRTIYTQFFSHYQKNARDYYHRQHKTLKQLNPSEYFLQINNIYLNEKNIGQKCYNISIQTLFNRQFAQQLLNNYKNILLTSQYGLKFILKQGQIKILQLIVQLYYKLTKSIDGFKQQFQQYIYQQMRCYLDDNKNQLLYKKSIILYCNFIQKINRKNKQLLQIVNSISIVGDFIQSYKTAIQKSFINTKLPITIQQLLAIYTDTKLKLNLKQQQFQQEVKNILIIFNCIQNKDLFLLKYTQKLCKRLLNITQTSLQNHQIFISNLKINCGIRYTQSLQTIITQYRMSNENQKYLNEIIQKQKLLINLTIKIFSQGAWPTQNILQIPIQFLPRQINHANNILKIYHNQYGNKKTFKISALESKIRWIYYFDQKINYKSQTVYFQTNNLQGLLLYYIYKNRPNRIPLETLQRLIQGISSKLIRQNLNRMTQCAQNILIRKGEGQDIAYQFNLLLQCNNKKLITYDQGTTQQQQKLYQQNDLGRDRQIVIDANISKLMKSKKIMDYKSLLEQVIKMIKVFVPQGRDIKMAIDRLISKDILERDQRQKQIIRYRQ